MPFYHTQPFCTLEAVEDYCKAAVKSQKVVAKINTELQNYPKN